MFILLAAVLLVLWAAQKWHRKHALRSVMYRFETSHVLVAPEQPFEMITKVANPTRMFIPYIRLTEYLPLGLSPVGDLTYETQNYDHEPRIATKIFLLPRNEWVRHMPASISKRGRFLFPHIWLRGGDFLGLTDDMRVEKRMNEIVVYPAPAEDAAIQPSMDNFLGDISVRRFIMEDPVLTVGFREYTGREPLKMISWLQSARLAKPMVKIFDYTAELSVSVVVDIDTQIVNANEKEQAIEQCYSLGHTVCRFLEQRKIHYDLFANFQTQGVSQASWQHLSKGLGEMHLHKVLEGLGRATHTSFESSEALLARVSQNGNAKGVIVITARDESRARILLSHHKIESAMILCGSGADRS